MRSEGEVALRSRRVRPGDVVREVVWLPLTQRVRSSSHRDSVLVIVIIVRPWLPMSCRSAEGQPGALNTLTNVHPLGLENSLWSVPA